ncbi:DUF3291 domain-containing protein [Spirosoma sp. HMF4905]|uniref:DUF3291 domain-containing protein n=1 Tax=Spirosoma arboris TaxID=2682092 RepID=A0A7K1SQN7_9BACT|nr:DUF3291 domain-containing protein [Spirosoma arboris]MVM36013.1 DUF3291 domain-containing protein [Spirosoma arboris]
MPLAQLNISRMLAPDINHPIMVDFVVQLDAINQLAEQSNGFIWRLTGDGNNATSLRPFEDDRIIVNMLVWESAETLQNFVFRSMHIEVMKGRRKWFEKPNQMMTVLWWVPTGHVPTVEEAKERLEHLNAHGPGPTAFTFRTIWPKPDVNFTQSRESV